MTWYKLKWAIIYNGCDNYICHSGLLEATKKHIQKHSVEFSDKVRTCLVVYLSCQKLPHVLCQTCQKLGVKILRHSLPRLRETCHTFISHWLMRPT